MRGNVCIWTLKNSKFWWKWDEMQNSTLPKFEISIFEKLGFGKIGNRHLTTVKKYKIGTSKPEIELRFGIFDSKINFLKSKIDFSDSSRILLRDLKIWNQRCRKPLNLYFRFWSKFSFSLQMFLRPKSWFCFRFGWVHTGGVWMESRKYSNRRQGETSKVLTAHTVHGQWIYDPGAAK